MMLGFEILRKKKWVEEEKKQDPKASMGFNGFADRILDDYDDYPLYLSRGHFSLQLQMSLNLYFW